MSGPVQSGGSTNGSALDIEARIRLMRDGVINNSRLFFSGIVGLVLVPIFLRGLGEENYGLWISALVLEDLLGSFDLGLGVGVNREVAASLSTFLSEGTIRFVAMAGTASVVMGIAGGLIIGFFGLPLGARLHLSHTALRAAPAVFACVGVAFAAQRLSAFSGEVLAGLRRFDLENAISVAGVFLKAGGFIVLILTGFGLVAVAAWYAASAVAQAGARLAVAARIEPRLRFAPVKPEWAVLKRFAPFSLGSKLATAALNLNWYGGPLLIGVILGAASVSRYYIAQKFPIALSGISANAAHVIFPAASEHERGRNMPGTRDLFDVGTRWGLVLMMPFAIVLWVIAPDLLRVWVRGADFAAVRIFRVTTAAVVVECLGLGALFILWGRGVIRTILEISGATAGFILGLTALLLPRSGLVSAAWVLFGTLAAACLFYLREAGRECGVAPAASLGTSTLSLLPAAAACLVAVYAVRLIPGVAGWTLIVLSSLAGGCSFVTALYFAGGRPEERRLMAQFVGSMSWPLRSTYRAAARAFRRDA